MTLYILAFLGYNEIQTFSAASLSVRLDGIQGKVGIQMNDTIKFSLNADKEREMQETLLTVYNALLEKGYDPVNQIVGYLLSEDPTYITNHRNARTLIRKLDRDELLQAMVHKYLQP